MGKRVSIVGLGPGDLDFCLPIALKRIAESQLVVGGRRNLEAVAALLAGKEILVVESPLEEVAEAIRRSHATKDVAVLVTGDPGLYSLMPFLKKRLPGIELDIVPGLSSLQYLCGKLCLGWEDLAVTSLHGREPGGEPGDFLGLARESRRLAVFAGGEWPPDRICSLLERGGLGSAKVAVGENLSYPGERIRTGTAAQLARMSFESLSILLLESESEPADRPWPFVTGGIPDELFVRGEVPMTKAEVRVLSLAKLRLESGLRVFDIGSGSGSVAVECALHCRGGEVFAIERDDEAVELIRKNAERFHTNNLRVIQGTAPEALSGLPLPDRVFIGGSGGRLEELLEWASGIPKPVGVVVNAVTVESASEALSCLERLGFDEVEMVQVAISRGVKTGGKHLMRALNPVSVIAARRAVRRDAIGGRR